MTRLLIAVALVCALAACHSNGPVPPAALDVHSDACASCRMAVSDQSLAAQITAPGEEPRFFDDIGCLAAYLRAHTDRAEGEVAYVADHRTRAWTAARQAIYTRVPDLETPMNSHLVAHADEASRAADRLGASGTPATLAEIFGATLPDGPAAGRTP